MGNKRRHNAKGRSEGEPRWLQVFYWLLECDAFADLSPNDVYVLLFLWKRYNGRNNGHIGFGVRSGCLIDRGSDRLQRPLNLSKSRIAASLNSLERGGFIACTQEGEYSGAHLAREWRLTWLKCDRSGDLPTKDFMRPVGERDTLAPAVRAHRTKSAARLLARRNSKSKSHGRDCKATNSPTGGTVVALHSPKTAPNSPTGGTVRSIDSPAGGTHIVTIPGDGHALSVPRALGAQRGDAAWAARSSTLRLPSKLRGP